MRGCDTRTTLRKTSLAISVFMVVMLVFACVPTTAGSGGGGTWMTSRSVHLDKAGDAEGGSGHCLNVSCAWGSEIRYSWRSEVAVWFSIADASGEYVRVLSNRDKSASIFTARSDGTHTLRWANPHKSYGTDLAYNVKVVHPNVLDGSVVQSDGDPNAYTLDDIAIVCIAGILASAFSIVMMLAALYMRAKPWMRPGPRTESYCLREYARAYGSGLPPPEGPTDGSPRR